MTTMIYNNIKIEKSGHYWIDTNGKQVEVDAITQTLADLVQAVRYVAPKSNSLNRAYHQAKLFLQIEIK